MVRHAENAPLLRTAGVDTVVVSAEAAGRLLGVSALSPATGELVSDLLEAGSGLELVERGAVEADIGRSPQAPTSCSAWCAAVGCVVSATLAQVS